MTATFCLPQGRGQQSQIRQGMGDFRFSLLIRRQYLKCHFRKEHRVQFSSSPDAELINTKSKLQRWPLWSLQMLCQHVLIALASWVTLLATTFSASAILLTTSSYGAPSLTMLTTSSILLSLFRQWWLPSCWLLSCESSLTRTYKKKRRRGKKTKLIPLPILPLPATDEPKKEIIATFF